MFLLIEALWIDVSIDATVAVRVCLSACVHVSRVVYEPRTSGRPGESRRYHQDQGRRRLGLLVQSFVGLGRHRGASASQHRRAMSGVQAFQPRR